MMNKRLENSLPTIFGQPGSNTPIYILSPHLDDAVWSMGGLLAQLSQHYEVHVVTVFSQSAFVYDELISPEQATLLRKSENTLALNNVGIYSNICLDFPEAVLRDVPLDANFDANYKATSYLRKLIKARLKQIIADNAVVLAPTAFGQHVDHLVIRNIAQELPHRIVFYEDMPYGARKTRVKEAKKFLLSQGRQERRLPIDDELMSFHLDRYNDYISQRKDHHIEQIKQYLSQKGYGLWT